MTGLRVVRLGVAGVLACAALACRPVAGGAVGLDAFGLEGTMGGMTPPVTLVNSSPLSPSHFTFSGGCGPTSPSFFSSDDGLGACQGANGGGSYAYLLCGTGLITANLTITEPSGETATAGLTMVLVAGVGVVEGGYQDDGGGGLLAGVGTVLPEPPSDCLLGATQFQAEMALVGQH